MSASAHNIWTFLLFGFGPFFIVAALMPLAAWAARRVGLVAAPGGRHVHEAPTPLVGGLVVFGTLLVWFEAQIGLSWTIVVPFLVLLAAGAWDDRFGMWPWVKFAAQLSAAALLIVGGDTQIVSLGQILPFAPPVELSGPAAAAISILCVVLMINAMNMMDGLDGLCAGLGVVMLVLLGSLPAFLCVPALAGFLVYNLRAPWRRRASVFFGDAGSMALGLLVAWVAIAYAQDSGLHTGHAPVTVAWILALPVMDALAQFARRASRGRSPLVADRGHLHHRLMDAGLSHGQAVAALLAASLALGLVGFAPVPQWVLACSWAALALGHIALTVRWGSREA